MLSQRRKDERTRWREVLREQGFTYEEAVVRKGHNITYEFDFVISGEYASIAIELDGHHEVRLRDWWQQLLNRLGNHRISEVLSFSFGSLKYDTDFAMEKIYTVLLREEEQARLMLLKRVYKKTS